MQRWIWLERSGTAGFGPEAGASVDSSGMEAWRLGRVGGCRVNGWRGRQRERGCRLVSRRHASDAKISSFALDIVIICLAWALSVTCFSSKSPGWRTRRPSRAVAVRTARRCSRPPLMAPPQPQRRTLPSAAHTTSAMATWRSLRPALTS